MQCDQSHTECTYPPTRDRAAYSRQYVQNLENRVQALESAQSRLTPLLEAFERGDVGPSAPPRQTAFGADTHYRDERPLSASEDNKKHGDVRFGNDGTPAAVTRAASPASSDADGGQLAQDERGNYRWIGSSNTLSLLDSFSHTRTRVPEDATSPSAGDNAGREHPNPYFGHVAGSGVVNALPSPDEVQFPSLEHANAMVDAFFDELYPALPVFQEKAFRGEYNRLMERVARGEPENTRGVSSSRRQSAKLAKHSSLLSSFQCLRWESGR